MTNTVFASGNVGYRFNATASTCEHDRRVTTFHCRQLNSTSPFCTVRGNCAASHHNVTGHLFYQTMIC
jgi:hypothetical protein